MNTGTSPIWPLGVFFSFAVIFIMLMMAVSFMLGQRHAGRVTGEPFESGMPLTGDARIRFSIKYYLVAMFFVVFDVEALFILAWAVSVREVGWTGYIEMVIFIGILIAALVYLWKLGALEWGTPRHKALRRPGVGEKS
ncbi:MAG TPA: NADH-quinone oxidoreductase subunit A [Desulfomonilia bacterium]|nr:NADH-quinone oxidoreductase subunit A [Desulfomonilia bacterium]